MVPDCDVHESVRTGPTLKSCVVVVSHQQEIDVMRSPEVEGQRAPMSRALRVGDPLGIIGSGLYVMLILGASCAQLN